MSPKGDTAIPHFRTAPQKKSEIQLSLNLALEFKTA